MLVLFNQHRPDGIFQNQNARAVFHTILSLLFLLFPRPPPHHHHHNHNCHWKLPSQRRPIGRGGAERKSHCTKTWSDFMLHLQGDCAQMYPPVCIRLQSWSRPPTPLLRALVFMNNLTIWPLRDTGQLAESNNIKHTCEDIWTILKF